MAVMEGCVGAMNGIFRMRGSNSPYNHYTLLSVKWQYSSITVLQKQTLPVQA